MKTGLLGVLKKKNRVKVPGRKLLEEYLRLRSVSMYTLGNTDEFSFHIPWKWIDMISDHTSTPLPSTPPPAGVIPIKTLHFYYSAPRKEEIRFGFFLLRKDY